MKRRVVVTGIGALTPIGNNPQELWESVKTGKCGIDFKMCIRDRNYIALYTNDTNI